MMAKKWSTSNRMPHPILLLLIVVVYFLGVTPTTRANNDLPYPFAPPDDGFCDYNTLGDDAYVSMFVPCTFEFYNTAAMPKHFSCDKIDSGIFLKRERRRVVMWPDACVALEPRCYDLTSYPDLHNYTLYDESKSVAMVFPSDATVVSVDCTYDYSKAKAFMDNLPDDIEDVAASLGIIAISFAVAVLAGVIACFCCCICACCKRNKSSKQTTYAVIPTKEEKTAMLKSSNGDGDNGMSGGGYTGGDMNNNTEYVYSAIPTPIPAPSAPVIAIPYYPPASGGGGGKSEV